MKRREFIGSLAATAAAPARRKPNIVFIILDDLGYGDFGCYGQKLIRTPNVDSVARAGASLYRLLRRRHRLRPLAGVADDRPPPGARAGPRQRRHHSAPGQRRDRRPGAETGRLRHRRLRQVGTRRRAHRRHPHAPRLRPLLRLPAPDPRALLLSRLPVGQRRQVRSSRQRERRRARLQRRHHRPAVVRLPEGQPGPAVLPVRLLHAAPREIRNPRRSRRTRTSPGPRDRRPTPP